MGLIVTHAKQNFSGKGTDQLETNDKLVIKRFDKNSQEKYRPLKQKKE